MSGSSMRRLNRRRSMGCTVFIAMTSIPMFCEGLAPSIAVSHSTTSPVLTGRGASRTLARGISLSMTAERRYDFEPWSVGTDQLDTPFEIRVQDINFRLSSDAQIAACGVAILAAVKHEARALRDSLITRSLVETCILEQNTLSDAMATILTSKICSDELPGSQGRKALLEAMRLHLSSPAVLRGLVSDIVKAFLVDPAADGLLQPLLFYKGIHALATHRVANALWRTGTAANIGVALMLQSRASELFAVDIHPAATVGPGVMLDHASGIVIGSTAVVGSDIYMLHQVTLGATGKPMGDLKRHPTVGDGCVLGAGCTVLGDIEIGDGATVGASAVVTRSVPPDATVVGVNKLIEKTTAHTESPDFDEYSWFYDI